MISKAEYHCLIFCQNSRAKKAIALNKVGVSLPPSLRDGWTEGGTPVGSPPTYHMNHNQDEWYEYVES